MRTFLQILDRTAVLAVGIVAGFAIGVSFHSGKEAGVPDGAIPPPSAPAGSPEAIRPAGPALPGGPPGAAVVGKGKAAPVAPAPIAANAPELAAPVDPRVAGHAAADGTIRVGVYGDSFGDGVWAALYHQLPASRRFKVFKFSQEGTGFTRYRSLNLADRLRGQLAGQPVDIAVISFGANDTQGVYGDDGHVYAFMSPGWQRTIGARVTQFVGMLKAQGAAVYWVGLPIMRKPSFDADVQAENGFYARLMAGMGVPWIETRSLSVDANGAFSPYLPDPVTGAPRLMRANDGIHMSMNGYARLTSGLAQRIALYADKIRARASGPGQAAATVAAPPPAPPPAPHASAPKGVPAARPQAAQTEASAPAPTSPGNEQQGGSKPTNLLPPSLSPPPASVPGPAAERPPLQLPDLEGNAAAPAIEPADDGKKHHKKKHAGDDQPSPAAQAPGSGG